MRKQHWLSRITTCAVVIAGTCTVALTSCASGGPSGGFEGDLKAFPTDSLSDWKSYGDGIAAITVVSEIAEPPSPEVVANGEGLVGRHVAIHVDRLFWQSPARTIPSSISIRAWGWIVRDGGNRTPAYAQDDVRLEVDHSYLVALAYWDDEWITVPGGLPFDDGLVGKGEWRGKNSSSTSTRKHPGIADLVGKNADGVQAGIDAARPDPIAERFRDLDPEKRWAKVASARESSLAPPQTPTH